MSDGLWRLEEAYQLTKCLHEYRVARFRICKTHIRLPRE